jgi:transposase-like protein
MVSFPSSTVGHRGLVEEAGDQLFTFTSLPPSQWRSARTTNASERLHGEFKRRIKTQTVLPTADTAAIVVLGTACFRPD